MWKPLNNLRTAGILAVAVSGLCFQAPTAQADDFLESIIKTVEDFGENKANARLKSVPSNRLGSQEKSALVSKPDYSRSGTAIVRTHAGLTFQVRDLYISSAPSIQLFCDVAEEFRFLPVNSSDQTRYKVRINFTDVGSSSGGISDLLSKGMDLALNDSKAGRHKVTLHSLSGHSLSGSRWRIEASRHRIREITFVQ